MRILLTLTIILAAQWAQGAVGDWRKDIKKNVDGFYAWFLDKLEDFPKTGTRTPQQVAAAGRYSSAHKTFNEYDKAAQSPYVKREFMDKLSLMSKELAKTAGTMLAPDSASKLRATAKNLKASSDPDFRQIGNDFEEQATAIEQGDSVKADQIAGRISTMQRPYVAPGYKPSKGESALVKTFGTVIAGVMSNLGGVVGGVVVSGLLKAVGFGGDDSTLGGPGRIVGESTGRGSSASSAGDKAGSAVIRTGGSEANSEINKIDVDVRKSMDSQNSGGAPSAQ